MSHHDPHDPLGDIPILRSSDRPIGLMAGAAGSRFRRTRCRARRRRRSIVSSAAKPTPACSGPSDGRQPAGEWSTIVPCGALARPIESPAFVRRRPLGGAVRRRRAQGPHEHRRAGISTVLGHSDDAAVAQHQVHEVIARPGGACDSPRRRILRRREGRSPANQPSVALESYPRSTRVVGGGTPNDTKGHEHPPAPTRPRPPSRNPSNCGGPFDGETRTRTGDTTIFSRVLYQLSYLASRRPMLVDGQ